MTQRLREHFPSFVSSILNSYTQVFFSNNRIFAILLLVVTFFDIYAGLCGLLSIIISNTLAYVTGFSRFKISSGYYGFNNLLVGLGLGVFYQPGIELFVLLVFVSFLTLFLTIVLEGVLGKYGLPYLSLSFLLSIWLVTLASRQFTTLEVSERGVYSFNDMYLLGGLPMVRAYEWFNEIPLYLPVKLYFKSLGAILFQYHLLPGILVAVGLLIYSRIAFLLSWVGFLSAYFYYDFVGANFNELNYGYIGFNFILTAIAVGGFFIVPSAYSFLWTILLTPLISIILTSTSALFVLLQLSIFSLPFNFVVLMFLYVLAFRERHYTQPQVVSFQNFSPEKNLYSHVNYMQRFEKSLLMNFSLPFLGTWKVTQGHNGEMTHKGEWRHAWDFEIVDAKGASFSGDGRNREDYYCFNKPILAPAAGWVEAIEEGIEENSIGEMNVHQNWGNTIVLRHADFLFTKYSHLKKGSIKISVGDQVKKGDVLAACGNSGRSPIPHLHFQVQATPYIGSKTIDYPFGRYIENVNGTYSLQAYQHPEKDSLVTNIEKNEALTKAFHLIPGQKINFLVSTDNGEKKMVNWEVTADIYNKTYVFCKGSGSKAWFYFDHDLLYFTHFEGNQKSLLFYYYLGAFKVSTGFYKKLTIADTYPLTIMNHPLLQFFQDFIAPFKIFMKPAFSLRYVKMVDHFTESKVWLSSEATMNLGWREIRRVNFEMEITNAGLERFVITEKKKRIEATRLEK